MRSLMILLASLGFGFLVGVPVATLAQSRPSPDYSSFPPEKRALLEADANRIATAQAGPMSAKPGLLKADELRPPPPTSDPASGPPRHPAGDGTIIEIQQAPYSSQDYIGVNSWVESKDGNGIVVYAGAEGRDPSQGVVIVVVSRDHQNFSGGWFPTPRKAGPVGVTGADGEVLTLTGPGGSTFTFDVATQRFDAPQNGTDEP